ncbi:MAG TPA: preprotein translocase subunit YajC [Solirubrobacterales bacterium]|nr:preprotein translocase subunit YajC [Solirubrobacterales bacterium]
MLALILAQAAAPDAAPTGIAGLLSSPLPLILVMFAIFYFMIIRPQSKQAKTQQDFLSKLQKGDEVVTNGGLFGKIYSVNDEKTLTLEIAPNVKVRVLKSQIAGPTQPAAAADGKPSEEPAKK